MKLLFSQNVAAGHALLAAITCIVVFWVTLTGGAGTTATILKYVQPHAEITMLQIPPPDSVVTLLRGLIMVMGAVSSYFYSWAYRR